jgi:multicomponent Na+:H+ antiporter subunit E
MMTLIHKILKILLFILFYAKEVLLANIRMAYLILSRNPQLKPAIIAIPMETVTEAQIALLANLITMTPGSLSIDVSTDRRALYVHVLDNTDPDSVKKEIQEGLQLKVRELFI